MYHAGKTKTIAKQDANLLYRRKPYQSVDLEAKNQGVEREVSAANNDDICIYVSIMSSCAYHVILSARTQEVVNTDGEES